jgi:hypothetical protein
MMQAATAGERVAPRVWMVMLPDYRPALPLHDDHAKGGEVYP